MARSKKSMPPDQKIIRRTLGLPRYLWERLYETARHKRRTPSLQMEVILVDYFELEAAPIEEKTNFLQSKTEENHGEKT